MRAHDRAPRREDAHAIADAALAEARVRVTAAALALLRRGVAGSSEVKAAIDSIDRARSAVAAALLSEETPR